MTRIPSGRTGRAAGLRLPRLGVQGRLWIAALVFVVGFGAFAAVFFDTLRGVQVHGPIYSRIVQGKDLIADVLPPPEYIIESYLVAFQLRDALGDPAMVASLVARGQQLRAEYDTRHTVWVAELEPGELREWMVSRSSEPAQAFFTLRDELYVPAVQAGDSLRVAELLPELRRHYELHRSAIDRVVELATARNAADEVDATQLLAERTRWLQILGFGIAGAAFVAIVLLARAIARPLSDARALLSEIADGDGDLTRRLAERGPAEVAGLAASFNRFADKILHLVLDVRLAADSVTTSSRELASSSDQLASSTQQHASSLEETAASLAQLTESVRQSADHAKNASAIASDSRESAERGGEVVTASLHAMEEISKASARIGEIISVIDEIAFQTNLLSLNAAVEAARAGEHGRGFAVVAAEVRNLAQRCSGAAREVKGLIQESGRRVEAGVQLAGRSGEAFEEIVSRVKRVSDFVTEIAAVADEQALGVQQASLAVNQMGHVVQATAAQSEELSATAQTLSEQAAALDALVGRFEIDDPDDFAAADETDQDSDPETDGTPAERSRRRGGAPATRRKSRRSRRAA